LADSSPFSLFYFSLFTHSLSSPLPFQLSLPLLLFSSHFPFHNSLSLYSPFPRNSHSPFTLPFLAIHTLPFLSLFSFTISLCSPNPPKMKSRIINITVIIIFILFALVLNFLPIYYKEQSRHWKIRNLKRRFNELLEGSEEWKGGEREKGASDSISHSPSSQFHSPSSPHSPSSSHSPHSPFSEKHLELLKLAINNYDSLVSSFSFDSLFSPNAPLDRLEKKLKKIRHRNRLIWQHYMLGFLLLIVGTFFLPPFVFLFKLLRIYYQGGEGELEVSRGGE